MLEQDTGRTMLAEIREISDKIDLIENTGVQFIDFELNIDWEGKTRPAKRFAQGLFISSGTGADNPLIRLFPTDELEHRYVDPFTKNEYTPASAEYKVRTADSLALFNQVWFPIPYIAKGATKSNGPTNWARARIVEITEPEDGINLGQETRSKPRSASSIAEVLGAAAGESQRRYRITVAIDTKIEDTQLNLDYFAPTKNDIEAGVYFEFMWKSNECNWFLQASGNGKPWVNEWCQSVFNKLAKERIYPSKGDVFISEAVRDRHEHEAHYLNLLAVLGGIVRLPRISLLSNPPQNNQAAVGVSLILDIGNSRSCGIMVEKHPNITREDGDFQNMYPLRIRDLNASEHVYEDAFESRVEFSRANFDFDNRSPRSGRPDAFCWPSLVRVGAEAANLSANRIGNEGRTGISSPKRYLWKTDGEGDFWKFNSYYYQVDSERIRRENLTHQRQAEMMPVNKYINSNGDALFALPGGANSLGMEAKYSYKSIMTFMLIEILLQAISQMNSYAQRYVCDNMDRPRNLENIIMTVPPSMPLEEREIMRSCLYEALGILWKCLGYDRNPDRFSFNFVTGAEDMYLRVPSVFLDWDEAQAGQVVYVYNETQKVITGRSQDFINALRRPDIRERLDEQKSDPSDREEVISARIASIDIGGGTTDLVIIDYAIKKNRQDVSVNIIPREVFRDGFRQAGDDIVHQIIRNCIIPAIKDDLLARRFSDPYSAIKNVFGKGVLGVQEKVYKELLTQQVLMKVALRVIEHLEHLPVHRLDVHVSGTVEDFLNGHEMNDSVDTRIMHKEKYPIPDAKVTGLFNKVIQREIEDYDLLKSRIDINLSDIHQGMVSGRGYEFTTVLDKLAEIVNLYDVDLLLLTGRPSKIPAVKSFMAQRLALPLSRVIQMHNYNCKDWYPFSSNGQTIGDPKTTAAVGALLSHTRLDHRNWVNFRFYSKPQKPKSILRFFGVIDNKDLIPKESVFYKYWSADVLEKISHRATRDFAWYPVRYNPETGEYDIKNKNEDAFEVTMAVHLGSRQLDDVSFNATPLYIISAISSVDEHEEVIKAKNIEFPEDDDRIDAFIRRLDPKIRDDYRNKLMRISNEFKQLEAKIIHERGSLIKALKVEAREMAKQQVRQIKSEQGIFSKIMNMGKDEDLYHRKVADYIRDHTRDKVEDVLEQRRATNTQKLQFERSMIIQEAIRSNISIVSKKYEAQLRELENLLNMERAVCTINIELQTQSSSYQNFIHKQLGGSFEVLKCKKGRILCGSDGQDYTDFFRLRFQTVSNANAEYWVDSGNLDLGD